MHTRFGTLTRLSRQVMTRLLNSLCVLSLLLTSLGPGAAAAQAAVLALPAAQSDPTTTPTTSPTATTTESEAATSTETPDPVTETPTATGTATETDTPEPSPSTTSTATPSATVTPTITATARSTTTATFTPTVMVSPTGTARPTATGTPGTDDTAIIDIEPTRGGTLRSRDGRVVVLFPTSAVTEAIRASYRPINPLDVPDRQSTSLIFAFELEARSIQDSTVKRERFDRPVHLTIDLTDIVTDTLSRGQELWLGYYDQQSESWMRAPFSVTTGVRGDEVFIEADIEHFSTWAPGYSVSPGWIPTFNEPQVDTFSGSANVSFPLEVPPGRGGIQPSLVLNYNSRQLDGLLGWTQSGWVGHGWELDTISIARELGHLSTGNNAHCADDWHPQKFFLTFNGAGYRIMPGERTATGVRYYTQIQSQLYIERRNNGLGGGSTANMSGEYWFIRDGQGDTYRLGYNADSELTKAQVSACNYSDPEDPKYGGQWDGRAAFLWRVDQVMDLSGNRMVMTYEEEDYCGQGELAGYNQRASYLKSIKYNEKDDASGVWTEIAFDLENRPDTDVGLHDGVNGCDRIFFQAKFLRAVRVLENGTLVRKYWFDYELVNSSAGSGQWGIASRRLTRIRQYGTDSTSALPDQVFTYEELANKTQACVPGVNCNPANDPCDNDVYEEWPNCLQFHYGRLKTIANGYGATTIYTYQSDGREAWWRWFNYRVTTREVYDGLHTTAARFEYAYDYACYNQYDTGSDALPGNAVICPVYGVADTPGTGALTGHGQVTVTAKDYGGATLSVTVYTFATNQNGGRLIGRPIRTEWRDANNNVLSAQDSAYDTPDLDTNNYRFLVYSTERYDWTYSGGVSQVTRNSYGYDDYGNLVAELNYGSELFVANPGFEAWNADWPYYGNPSPAEINSAVAFVGRRSLQLNAGSDGGAYQDILGLTPGMTYTIRAMVLGSSGNTSQFMFWLDDTTGGNTLWGSAVVPNTTWQLASATYVANSTGKVRVHLHRGLGGSGTIYVDEVAVARSADVGDERSIHRFYINLSGSLSQWLVGLKWAENVYAGITANIGGSTLKAQTHWYYDDLAYDPNNWDWWNQPGQYTHGRVTMVGRGICTPTTCVTPDFVTTRYQYDAWGNRTHETDPNLNATITDYDDQYHLFPEKIISPIAAISATLEYYGIDGIAASGYTPGLLKRQIDPNGNATQYTYDVFGRLSAVIRPGDSETNPTTSYAYSDGMPTKILTLQRETSGCATCVLGRAEYYDGLGRQLQVRQEAADSANYQVVTNMSYDALGRLIQGYVPAFEAYSASFSRPAGWDSRPSSTSAYDALGRAVGGANPDGSLNVVSLMGLTATTLDANRNLRMSISDSFGRTVSVQEPQTGTATSNIFSDSFSAGQIGAGWVVAGQTLESGTVKSVGTGTNWDRTFYRATAAITGGTHGQGVTVEFKLSGTDPTTVLALQSPAGAPYRRLGINTSGNKLYVQYRADAETWVYPTDLVNPLVKDVWYVLRLQVLPSGVGTVEVWRQDNPAQKWGYVAPMPDNVTYQFQHWVWGGTSWLDNYQEYDLVAPNTWTTSYQYDVLDQLTRVTDTLGVSTVITYNALGFKTGMLDPDMGPWGYTYDPAGNLQTQTDARGCVTTFSYDPLNRLTGKTYAGLGACGTTTPVTYGYDAGTNGAGQRTSLVDASGITAWAYDTRGQVITETRTITGTGSFTTAFRYDAAGRVLTTTYPTGEVITQSYNLASQLLQVRSSTYGTSYASGLQYNAFGQPLTATLGNTVVIANTYDPRSGRLLATVSKIGSTPRLDLAYTYDLGGNVTQIVDAVRNETSAYTYDMLDRLLTSQVSVNGVGLVRSETYAYDRVGNILSVTRWPQTTHLGQGSTASGAIAANTTRGSVTGLAGGAARLGFTQNGGADVPLGGAWLSASYAYTHSQHVHAVTSLSSGASFSYDANGNMIGRSEGGRVYTQTFDAENRLVSVAQAGVGTTTYVYDGDGQLTKQVNPGGAGTLYLGVVEYDLNPNGTTAGSTSYYALPGARAVRNSAGLFYVLTDHLGSASVSLDGGGNVVAEMRYDAFGATRWSAGAMPGDRLYTGQVWTEVGLYYFNARWYSPFLGRWTQPDSIVPQPGLPQALNRYSYVYNSPLKFVDPSGYDPIDSVWENAFYAAHGYWPTDIDRQDRLFSVIHPGSGPNGEWTDDDWAYYASNRANLWANQLRWKGDRLGGIERFRAHTNQLASSYADDETDQFVRAFALFFGGVAYDAPAAAAAIRSAGGPEFPFFQEGMEGWRKEYVDPEGDQAHHYAGLFFVGYFFGAEAGIGVNHVRDQVNGYNQPDLKLGDVAAVQGADFAAGAFSPWQLTVRYFSALSVVHRRK